VIYFFDVLAHVTKITKSILAMLAN